MQHPFPIPSGWFQVAWSDEIEPGQVIPRYYFGRHLAMWRDEQGGAHLTDAFCPHLGAHFGHGGKVEGCELVCPFHGWQFGADGTNTLIPYSERTNQKAKLRTYPVREIGGLVMAWYHPHDAAPSYDIDEPSELTDPEFTDWHTKHFTVRVPVQEMAENSVDGPHFRYVHNTEIVPEIESYETEGPRARMRSIQRFPTPRGVVDGRIDVDNQGPGFGVTRFSGIVDTFLVGAAVPVDEGRSEVRFSFKVRKLGDEGTTSNVGKAFIDEVCKQFGEDTPIWENKAHIVRPALADTDPPYLKFRKWYRQFYIEGVDSETDVFPPAAPEDGQPVVQTSEGSRARELREKVS